MTGFSETLDKYGLQLEECGKLCFANKAMKTAALDELTPYVVKAHERMSLCDIKGWFDANTDLSVSVNTWARRVKLFKKGLNK